MSRPVWARGLKQTLERALRFAAVSRPVWARGLKQSLYRALLPCL